MAGKISSLVKAGVINKNGFYSIGGCLAVDFANTLKQLPDGNDGLNSFENLMLFLKSMGHLDEETASEYHMYIFQAPDRCNEVLMQARKLRTVIRSVLAASAAETGIEAQDLQFLNSLLASQTSFLEMRNIDGKYSISRKYIENGPEALLSAVAADIGRLIVSDQYQKVRKCAQDSCELFFINKSRNGLRRWCSMATCGNRSKVNAYLDRNA